MKKAIIFLMGVIIGALFCMGFVLQPPDEVTITPEDYRKEIISISLATAEEVKQEIAEYHEERVAKDVYIDEDYLKEIELLSKCVEAEAGNQDLLGKRLVVDVILNRVDSGKFPDDVIGVITQENQFSVYSNGALERAVPSEETIEAVKLELERRTDSEILYFRTGHPHSWCEHYYQHGAHFFGY